MIREEAKELFKKSSDFAVYYFDHTEVLSLNQSDIILNQIYDEHEAQMKAKDEAIIELEEAMKQRTCNGCKYQLNSNEGT